MSETPFSWHVLALCSPAILSCSPRPYKAQPEALRRPGLQDSKLIQLRDSELLIIYEGDKLSSLLILVVGVSSRRPIPFTAAHRHFTQCSTTGRSVNTIFVLASLALYLVCLKCSPLHSNRCLFKSASRQVGFSGTVSACRTGSCLCLTPSL